MKRTFTNGVSCRCNKNETRSHAPRSTWQLAVFIHHSPERGPKRLAKHIVNQQVAYLAIDETCIHKKGCHADATYRKRTVTHHPILGHSPLLSITVVYRGLKRVLKHVVNDHITNIAIDETKRRLKHGVNHHITNVTIDETYIHRAYAKHRTIAVTHLPRHTILPILHHNPAFFYLLYWTLPIRNF